MCTRESARLQRKETTLKRGRKSWGRGGELSERLKESSIASFTLQKSVKVLLFWCCVGWVQTCSLIVLYYLWFLHPFFFFFISFHHLEFPFSSVLRQDLCLSTSRNCLKITLLEDHLRLTQRYLVTYFRNNFVSMFSAFSVL